MRFLRGFPILAVLVLVSAAAQQGLFLIDGNHVGKLAVGMPESQIYRLYANLRTHKVDLQLEGDATPAVEIYLSPRAKDPALIVRLTGPGTTIDEIEVSDSRFRGEAGIHVGSNFGQLRRAYGKLELAVGEGQYCVFSQGAGLSFCLDINTQTETALEANNGDVSSIPDSAVIKYILVVGKRP